MGYQPPLSHPVFYNGTAINAENWQTGTNGVAITRVEGWHDAPDVRDVRELNSGRDGELADNLYLGGRTITLEGVISGSSYADLQTKKLALSAKLIPSSSEYVLKMPLASNASPSWTHADSMADFERVNARVIEGVQYGENDGPLLQAWSVVLRASDPLVYSDTLTTVDSGTTGTAARTAAVSNTGTYPSPGKIVVTGPTATTWTVSDSDGDTLLQFSGLTLAGTSSNTAIDIEARTITTTQPYKETRLSLATANSLWMLDETAGTTADNAEGTAARDGTYTGGYTLNQAGPATGLTSVDLNGTTGYISVPYSAALWPTRDLFEIWFNTDAISGTQTIFDSLSSQRGWRLEIDSSGYLDWSTGRAGVTVTKQNITKLAASTWYQVIIDMTSSGAIYVNGSKLLPIVSVDYPDKPTATGFRLGSTLAGTNFFNGKIGPVFQLATSSALNVIEVLTSSLTNSGVVSSYDKLDFATALWSNIDTGSTTYTLDSTGLNTGSKLSVQYRSARI